jgi:hypothetical protein
LLGRADNWGTAGHPRSQQRCRLRCLFAVVRGNTCKSNRHTPHDGMGRGTGSANLDGEGLGIPANGWYRRYNGVESVVRRGLDCPFPQVFFHAASGGYLDQPPGENFPLSVVPMRWSFSRDGVTSRVWGAFVAVLRLGRDPGRLCIRLGAWGGGVSRPTAFWFPEFSDMFGGGKDEVLAVVGYQQVSEERAG